MDLTDSEIIFLYNSGISEDRIFDGRNFSPASYKHLAKSAGQDLVLSSSHCEAYGHRIRTRYGHCYFCDTEKLAHQNRYGYSAYVYIAYSKAKKLNKIGITSDYTKREISLNNGRFSYGGTNDWLILAATKTKNAARVENKIHAQLDQYAAKEYYLKNGDYQATYELFSCSTVNAFDAYKKIVIPESLTGQIDWEHPDLEKIIN